MSISSDEILETIAMIERECLDVRTVTMGISLQDCSHPDAEITGKNIIAKIGRLAGRLHDTARGIEMDYGIPIINTRISVTPISQVMSGGDKEAFRHIANCMDEAARRAGVNFIGGIFTNLTHDHLDYHKNFENYFGAKKRYTKYQHF